MIIPLLWHMDDMDVKDHAFDVDHSDAWVLAAMGAANATQDVDFIHRVDVIIKQLLNLNNFIV